MSPTRPDYYGDARYCMRCQGYVPYLTSPGGAFCVHCDSGVHLFSPEDRHAFRQGLAVEGSLARRYTAGAGGGDEPRFVSQRGSHL
jgi:hypothetical protein